MHNNPTLANPKEEENMHRNNNNNNKKVTKTRNYWYLIFININGLNLPIKKAQTKR